MARSNGARHASAARLPPPGTRGHWPVEAGHPDVNIQVLRSDAPFHVGQLRSFDILSFGDHADLDVVRTENLTSAVHVEQRDQVSMYREAARRLASAAESVEASAELIAKTRKLL
ncbi:Scr1 family TA system antitoxin-like transcriptional regulator [Streptomyces sp. NPDC052097]|uniref:Scr1 family TA system antitoxin-like transcriptional regulator n=1 Tax=Streptomyces sp. NPDC052097 TaxID=3154948 RepID=UPI003450513D